MYSCVSLNRKNFKQLIELDKNRQQFNMLNECFSDYYRNIKFMDLLLLYKRVKLLKCNNKVDGYIWVSKYDKNLFIINSMYADGRIDLLTKYKKMLTSINLESTFLYECERNSYNNEVLISLGFKKIEGTYEMSAEVAPSNAIVLNSDITFKPIEKGKEEEIRCRIQNEVFKNDSRIPLTKEDIYYDEVQSYYFDKGSIFIKKGSNYIGYGQIILNKDNPTIVNVGILEDFRGQGYGRILMNYLMRVLNENGYKKVNLKVSSNNNTALKLYKSMGFNIIKEVHRWECKGTVSK